MNVYDAIRKFSKEVAKVGNVSDMITGVVMAYIRTQEEQHPQPTQSELIGIMNCIERTFRNHTKAFVSFEIFSNLFTATIVYNLGQKNAKQTIIICTTEGEIANECFTRD